MEKVAVVILNWNGKNYLEKFLPGVIKNSREAAIYVADNCSTDDSISFVSTNFPEVKIICNTCNEGFSEGYNQALKQIQASYYVLLNSDVEVTPNWIQPVIRLMDSDRTIAACQPKIKSYQQKDMFEYAGAAGGYMDRLGYAFCRGRIFDTLEKDEGQYDNSTPVFWATGACLFIRSEAYFQAGGLDKDFFAHMEEIDLCWRLQKLGWKIYYCGQSEVYHVGGGSLTKSNPKKTYLNFRNNIAMLIKNLPERNFWQLLFIRFILDGVAGIKFLFSDGPGHFVAVIKAHLYIYRHFNSLFRKRKSLRIHKTEPYGIYDHSLIADYYIRKKKKYSDLIH